MKYLIALLLLTNPVQAGFDDIWNQRIAREPDQVGIASIYHDRRVATGERFDSTGLTCAHRTRPLCTLAQDRVGICPSRSYIVVRLEGRSVTCRVNDRGPHIAGRIVDLTQRAAKQLGLTFKQGIARVTLD